MGSSQYKSPPAVKAVIAGRALEFETYEAFLKYQNTAEHADLVKRLSEFNLTEPVPPPPPIIASLEY